MNLVKNWMLSLFIFSSALFNWLTIQSRVNIMSKLIGILEMSPKQDSYEPKGGEMSVMQEESELKVALLVKKELSLFNRTLKKKKTDKSRIMGKVSRVVAPSPVFLGG